MAVQLTAPRLQDYYSTFMGLTMGYREADIDIERLQSPFCQKCAAHFEGIAAETATCHNCRTLHPHFSMARSAFPLKGELRNLIHAYKYNGEFWLRRIFAHAMLQAYNEYFTPGSHHLLVPVPLSRARKKDRGFNQSYELALLLAKKLSLPLRDCLIRIIHTEKQTKLSRKIRLKNVSRAFQLRKKCDFSEKSILLIDDVLTTGSTTSACANVLLRAHAKRVDVLTLARA